MNDVLIWTQGGQKTILFSKHIVCITEDENKTHVGCDISVTYSDDPIKASISSDEVLQKLGIKPS